MSLNKVEWMNEFLTMRYFFGFDFISSQNPIKCSWNIDMLKMMQTLTYSINNLTGRLYGRAVEGDVFASPEAVSVHLKNLMQESKKQVGFILN